MLKLASGAVLALLLASVPALAADKKDFRCEKKEDGKWVVKEDVKNRKACKKAGGKWIKAHDHDHGEGDHDHDHDAED